MWRWRARPDRPRRADMLRQLVSEGLRNGFLSTLPRAAAERLVADGIRISVPAGSVFYHEEEPPRVVIVMSGLIRVFLTSPDGRQVTVRYVRSGEVAGLPLVVGGPAPMNIQAMTASSVVALSVEALRSLLTTDPVVARACAEELTRQLYRALDEISEQTFMTVRQRVARQLLDLVAGQSPPFVVRLSQQELADEIGTVREVVTRTLNQLRKDGLVETSRDGIELLDIVRLGDEAVIEERAPVQSPIDAATPSPSPAQRTRGASRHRRSRS